MTLKSKSLIIFIVLERGFLLLQNLINLTIMLWAVLKRCTAAKCTINLEDVHKLIVEIDFLINEQGLTKL